MKSAASASKALKFGENDLVYGVAANSNKTGILVDLKNEAGGNLLSGFLAKKGKDPYLDFGGDWKKASEWAMNEQLKVGGKIHFDVTHIDVPKVLRGGIFPRIWGDRGH